MLIVKSIDSDVVGSNDPQTDKYGLFLSLSLYSDDGVIEIFIAEKDYTKTSRVTQPEINRIVQSLHRIEAKGRERHNKLESVLFALAQTELSAGSSFVLLRVLGGERT